ncbi:nonribosomal siderophore peptide synthase SidC [Beauveria bassiana ARSEF 2860]|uniref:Nonribosomal siderophore peptide synthase SidC n=1 Tax=Beauveria bassiana (strain ARSEF 2860) TaxID=655819 RepID=J4KR01_BEAB2|nr:nonribosomal siderophore peptide synthase SidC [Beauveria bassiana ARSEF 2860]EJP70094.1 nonribosomal siderophore peptide synthase SidC [Beauveria bassiana ARSEF 2860]
MIHHAQSDLPLTQVPCFGTEIQGNTTTSTYHELKTSVESLPENDEDILKGFGRYIAQIAETAQPSFCAQLSAGECTVGVDMSPTGSMETKRSSWRVSKQEMVRLHYDNFCILISKAAATPGVPNLSGALQLIVTRDDDSSTASLSIRLRASHGPLDAATHLLKLAACTLVSETYQPTLMSRFNVGIGLESLEETGLNQSISGSLASGTGADNAALVHTAFENQVLSRPDNILIEYLSRDDEFSLDSIQSLTYKDVHTRATALARELVEIERYADWKPMTGQQRAVPILLPTCPEIIIAIMGILKAGYAACPMAVDRPAASLQEILGDLNAVPVIGRGPDPFSSGVSSNNSPRQLSSGRFIWVDLDNLGEWRTGRILTAPIVRPLPVPASSDIAYVIFTSGSTGKPKGVLVPHRAMVSSISSFARRAAHLPTGPRLRWFVMNLPSFDAYQLDVLHVILRGGTLCLAERSLVLTDVERAINRLRATATTTVSSLAVILRPEKLPTLQTIVAGGEMLHQQVVDNFGQTSVVGKEERRQPARHLINGYGPTETAIVVATELMSVTTRGSIIGEALPTSILVIIDPVPDVVREVPAGVPGELAIGGPQLSHGYLNRPVETSQAFVTHTTLGRLYRTGDKARVVWASDGQRKIEILGRLALEQVKINGRRMELGEVESCLLGVGHVREAAVVPVQNFMLAAFLVLRNGEGVAEDTVKAACHRQASEHLAPWMRPSSYHVVPSLPRTPNDKIDRRELKRSMEERSAAQDAQPALEHAAQYNDTVNGIKRLSVETQFREVANVNGDKQHAHTGLTLTPATRSVTQANSSPSATIGSPPAKQSESPVVLVYRGLAAAIGDNVRSHPRETPTSSIGLDSIRAMTLLRALRAEGVTGLTIMDVLSATHIQDIIAKVESVTAKGAPDGASGSEQDKDTTRKTPNGFSNSGQQRAPNDSTTHQASVHDEEDDGSDSGQRSFEIIAPDEIDPDPLRTEQLKSIPIDDEDAIYELDAEAKVWHYDYHCRSQCAKDLNLKEEEIEQVLPATGIQMRLLYLATDPSFNDPQRYQGKAQVDHVLYLVPLGMEANRLRRAIETVVRRHDIFRTVFTPTKHPLAEYAQVVLSRDAPRAALQTRSMYVDDGGTEHVANSDAWKKALTQTQEDAEQSMGLDTPSIRMAYVQSLDEQRCVIVLSLMHTIYDGVAFRLFRAAVAAEYDGTPLGMELLPFKAAVEDHLAADWFETILFLMSRYANVPVFRTGNLRPRTTQTREYKELHYQLYPSNSHMRRFSIRARITLNELMGRKHSGLPMSGQAVVQAAWAKMLSQTIPTGGTRLDNHGATPTFVEFTTAFHGRYSEAARRTMGPLLTGLPIMIPISAIRADNKTNREVCSLLSMQNQQLLSHMAMPCPNMEMAQVGMDRADTGLVLQIHDLEQDEAPDARSRLPDLPLFHHDSNVLHPYKPLDSGFVIMAEVWPGVGGPDDNLTLICSYNSQRPGYEFLSRSWVLSALVSFDEAMTDILENPEASFCGNPVAVNGQK